MTSIKRTIFSVFALIVLFAATGVPQVIHLCTTSCVQTESCCDEANDSGKETDDCCTDLIAIHQIEVVRGVEAAVPNIHVPHIAHCPTLAMLTADNVGQIPYKAGIALAPYLLALFTDHPPKPEVLPLRL